jgi:hypothetical protein
MNVTERIRDYFKEVQADNPVSVIITSIFILLLRFLLFSRIDYHTLILEG